MPSRFKRQFCRVERTGFLHPKCANSDPRSLKRRQQRVWYLLIFRILQRRVEEILAAEGATEAVAAIEAAEAVEAAEEVTSAKFFLK
jgi:hypothetical protein